MMGMRFVFTPKIRRKTKSSLYILLIILCAGICVLHYSIAHNLLQVKTRSPHITRIGVDNSLWTVPKVPNNLKKAHWNNEELIDHIRTKWIISPRDTTDGLIGFDKPYFPEAKSRIVNEILQNRTGGFFVECGSSDGVKSSDTIVLEREMGWKGLLIEPDPALFARLRARRQNYIVKACASPTDHAMVLPFTHLNKSTMNGLTDYMAPSHYRNIRDCGLKNITIQCFPLASILKAVGVTKVDYLSLDVEGPELDVLRYVPFEEYDIDIVAVECAVMGDGGASQEKMKKIKEFMTKERQFEEIPSNNRHDIILRKVNFEVEQSSK